MSSQPTVLSPWYVVQRPRYAVGHHYADPAVTADPFTIREIEYYTSMELDAGTWQEKKAQAMLFMSLVTASRVADEEDAEVRVLYRKEHAKEFDRYE